MIQTTDLEKSIAHGLALATAQSHEAIVAMARAVESFAQGATWISLDDLRNIGLPYPIDTRPVVRKSARRMRAQELVALYRGGSDLAPSIKWPQSFVLSGDTTRSLRRLSLAGLTRQETEARLARRG